MIKVNNISKVFIKQEKDLNNKKNLLFSNIKKKDFLALDNVSFEVDNGEILGVLGPNGAGKTTLLRIITRIMKQTSGDIIVNDDFGKTITNEIEIKKRIGYLSENTKLYERFTIRELLSLFAEIYGLSKKEADNEIQKIFDFMKLNEFGNNKIGNLSTGQKQRASIARCLIHNPDIYIFDEPTLGLDILSSETIIEFMKKEKKHNKAIIYSTHYMEEAEAICDRIIMLHKGRIVATGTPYELKKLTNTSCLREAFKSVISYEGEIYEY